MNARRSEGQCTLSAFSLFNAEEPAKVTVTQTVFVDSASVASPPKPEDARLYAIASLQATLFPSTS